MSECVACSVAHDDEDIHDFTATTILPGNN